MSNTRPRRCVASRLSNSNRDRRRSAEYRGIVVCSGKTREERDRGSGGELHFVVGCWDFGLGSLRGMRFSDYGKILMRNDREVECDAAKEIPSAPGRYIYLVWVFQGYIQKSDSYPSLLRFQYQETKIAIIFS